MDVSALEKKVMDDQSTCNQILCFSHRSAISFSGSMLPVLVVPAVAMMGLRILGFRGDQIRKIPSDKNFRMDVSALEKKVMDRKLHPHVTKYYVFHIGQQFRLAGQCFLYWLCLP
jgi:hypothetical protein